MEKSSSVGNLGYSPDKPPQIKVSAENAMGRSVSDLEAAEWACEHLMKVVKGGSWRVYKSLHLGSISDQEIHKKVALIYAEKGIMKNGERRKRMPSKRLKNVDEYYEDLMAELRKSSYKSYGKATRAFFRASMLTGLRPVEWMYAKVIKIDGASWLRCRNAKTWIWTSDSKVAKLIGDRGTTSVMYRTIPIDHYSEEDQSTIAWVVYTAEQMATMAGTEFDEEAKKYNYNRFYEAMRQTLSRACSSLWPDEARTVNLYSARHAFKDIATNRLLKDGHSPEAAGIIVSVLMGHGSTVTKSGYGVGGDTSAPATKSMMTSELQAQVNVLLHRALSQLD